MTDDKLILALATPGLEWMSDHDWSAATAIADLDRIQDGLSQGTSPEQVGLAVEWAQSRIAEDMIRHRGIFEQCHNPKLATYLQELLITTRHLYRAVHKLGATTFEFDLDWLVELGSCIPANRIDMGILLQCAGRTVPNNVRVEWQLRTLSGMQHFAESVSPSLIISQCAFYQRCDVRGSPCREVNGLWLALVRDNPDIRTMAKHDLAFCVLNDDTGAMDLTAIDILHQYCPSAVPHWPVISGLGMDILQAYDLVFAVVAPALSLPTMDAP